MAIIKGSGIRKADHPIDNIFLDRWSPRAMSGEEIPETELLSLFEAARWAPSSNNNQPWRILYARRNTGLCSSTCLPIQIRFGPRILQRSSSSFRKTPLTMESRRGPTPMMPVRHGRIWPCREASVVMLSMACRGSITNLPVLPSTSLMVSRLRLWQP
jgi:hypothetical protein